MKNSARGSWLITVLVAGFSLATWNLQAQAHQSESSAEADPDPDPDPEYELNEAGVASICSYSGWDGYSKIQRGSCNLPTRYVYRNGTRAKDKYGNFLVRSWSTGESCSCGDMNGTAK